MKIYMFLLVLIFLNSLVLAQTNQNLENRTPEVTVKIEKTFNEKSNENIKKLLKSRKAPLFFISRNTIKSYYKTFQYNLIWTDENGIKNIAIDLLDAIKNDPVLKPHAKQVFKLDKLIKSLNSLNTAPDKYIQSMTKVDFMLTGIYNKYMRYLSRGYIDWKTFKKQLKDLDEESDINADWEKYNVRKNFKKLLLNAVENKDLSLALNEVNFTFPKAKELSKKILEFEELVSNGGYTKFPKSKTLRLGNKSPVVKVLRKRLLESHDLVINECVNTVDANNITTASIKTIPNKSTNITTQGSEIIENNCFEVYDNIVKEAVISFQKSHGLKADGIVGPTTRRYLNIPVQKKIVQMRLNLERMRWMPRTLGEKYLLVNIPEYKLKMYDGDEVKLDMRVVVGKKTHPTPIFSNKMSFVVLNPYWRIPNSIVTKEIIPKILENPEYLSGKGINIHETWDHESDQLDVNSVDWNLYVEDKKTDEDLLINEVIEEDILVKEEEPELPIYRFIQIPSNTNPLGRMKFMFPNKYSVYLHDSPAKQFFKYNKRAYSHGCVRLAEPKKLLEAIANSDINLDYTQANGILEEIDKTQIDLNKKIPVHMVYLTSWIDENGKIQFRDDIYKYDKMQKKLLYKNNKFM